MTIGTIASRHEAGRTGATAWDRYGRGDGVPLVALHGWTDDGACWSPSIARWVGGREVLTVDARGHGRTPLPEEPFTIAALAGDVAAVVAEVLGRPTVVVGHSMGGLVAQELALSAPELVAGLVLEDPAWRVGRVVDSRGIPVGLRDGVLAMAGREVDWLRDLGRQQNPGWPLDEIAPWAEAKHRVDPRVIDLPHRWDERDWGEALAAVRVPVTLLTGRPERGAIVDAEQVRRVQDLLGPLLRHVPLPTGHSVRREARAEAEAAVLAALLEADAGASALPQR
ncbi:alpha/beta fold hydrolase [Actinotalea sp.]|uniref:alpha/beta fold hydrolase n=1 Tax=Actinotalea sp. TaxID=1872145 RepID=UPI0035687F14